jgi:DNA mismatch repair protein MutL
MTPAIPGVLSGGVYTSRWAPREASSAGGEPGSVEAAPTGQGTGFSPAGGASIRPLIALGQFRDTFIVAMDDDGICIIDQHVAHERVLFERIMQRLSAGRLESQRLLVPIVLELAPAERAALLARAPALERFGFDVEEFGGDTTLKLTSLPALLNRDDCETAVRAAVKANYPLTAEKMRHILDELAATAYSTVCPHGRPVMLRITRREVEKNFERI